MFITITVRRPMYAFNCMTAEPPHIPHSTIMNAVGSVGSIPLESSNSEHTVERREMVFEVIYYCYDDTCSNST